MAPPSSSARFGELLAGAQGIDFAAISAKLPTGRDPETTAIRKKLFQSADVNGNGFLSQAEVDKAVGEAIGSEYLFSAKPVITRAFAASKDMGGGKSSDYVEKSEFRLCLVYLRQYFELYVAYNRLDSSDDRRLSLPEFKAGVKLLETWGIDIEDVDAEFAAIDTNGGGIVLFDEFCDWAIKKQLDLEDDDDWEDDAPPTAGEKAAAAAEARAKPPPGRTKALVVGINYFNGQAPLDGAVNDAERIKGLLGVKGFSTGADTMRVLKDNASVGALMPTRANILKSIDWLVKGAKPGDALFFHFSGHGTQQPDTDSTEADGMDECLVPSDHEKNGLITDDQLFDRLVRPLPKGVRLTCLFDCCHSGTGLDLPFTVTNPAKGWATEEGPLSLADADVRLFSGCQDGEESYGAPAGAGTKAAGAMTTAFIKAINAGAAPTYTGLLDTISTSLSEAGLPQRCGISSTIAFDLSTSFDLSTAASPQDPNVLPPPKGREERPAGQPKPPKKFKARSLPAGTEAPPTFKAPPKSTWKDAPATRGGATKPAAGGGARPLASQEYGSNLAGGHNVDWAKLTGMLPVGKTPEAREARKKMFGRFDFNGNGYLSLAEVDKAIRDELNQPQLFSSKPVLMRAFQAAKGSGKAKSELSDDYVELGEFRLLLVYLRQYFELDVAYNRLDSSDDRRLSLPEFRAGVEMLKQWGVNVAPDQVEAEFKLIDTNGGGIVLFDEFADWAIKKELDLEDDDDFDDGTEIRFVSAAEGAGHARTGRSTGRPQSSRGRSTSSSRSPKPGGGRPSSAFGSARPGTAGSRGSGMVSPKRLPAPTSSELQFDGTTSFGGSIPPTPNQLAASQERGFRPATRGKSLEASSTGVSLEARGANPRLAYDRPLNMPTTMSQPIGAGPMPTRPISALGRSLSRPSGPREIVGPAQVGGQDIGRSTSSEFTPPGQVIAPVKPRVTGGAFSKAPREVGGTMKQGSFEPGTGKSTIKFPWQAERGSAVSAALGGKPMPGTGRRQTSAVLGPGGRAYPQMDIDTAPRPKPSRIEAAPHGPTLGDFFIDSTMDQTFRGY